MAASTDMPQPSRRRFLMTAPAAAVAVGKIAHIADAELLHLGAELERAWERQREALKAFEGVDTPEAEHIIDAAWWAAYDLVEKIRELSATTLDGFRVKARAISWCHDGDRVELSRHRTVDICTAESILRDLLAIGRA